MRESKGGVINKEGDDGAVFRISCCGGVMTKGGGVDLLSANNLAAAWRGSSSEWGGKEGWSQTPAAQSPCTLHMEPGHLHHQTLVEMNEYTKYHPWKHEVWAINQHGGVTLNILKFHVVGMHEG